MLTFFLNPCHSSILWGKYEPCVSLTFFIFLSGWRMLPDFCPEQAPFEFNSQDSSVFLIELQVFPLLINFSNISPLNLYLFSEIWNSFQKLFILCSRNNFHLIYFLSPSFEIPSLLHTHLIMTLYFKGKHYTALAISLVNFSVVLNHSNLS